MNKTSIHRKNTIRLLVQNSAILFPLCLIFLSEILQFSFHSVSSVLKALSVVYMLSFAIASLKYSKTLLFCTLIFLPFFIYGILISFNMKAALTEGVRYLFPIAVLFYGYSNRRHFYLFLNAFLAFVLINNVAQISNYIFWLKGDVQWFYLRLPDGHLTYNTSSGIIRATGIVGFFGLFGYINLIAYFITRKFYDGKYKFALLCIFIAGMFLSFSYKTLGTFVVLLFLEYKNKLKLLSSIGVLFVFALISIPKVLASMAQSIVLRIQQYITIGDSARAESYRVMFHDFMNFNLFGRGIGSFGGPSSVTYDSPVYYDVNFNWYSTIFLTTTDTFYPHLFVEMGIIGGLSYLILIASPLLFLRWKKSVFNFIFIIYFSLFLDALFSYSLNNIAFLAVSILFVFPLYYFQNKELKANAIVSNL